MRARVIRYNGWSRTTRWSRVNTAASRNNQHAGHPAERPARRQWWYIRIVSFTIRVDG